AVRFRGEAVTSRQALRVTLVSALLSASGLALAADTAPVVARSGDAVITQADVERRLASTRLAPKAGAPDDPARRVLEEALIPELQASLEAKRRGIDKSPRVADRTREVLRQALERAVKQETLEKDPVTREQIRAYYEENRSKYEQPLRIRIWRILAPDQETARKVLEEVKKDGKPAKWSELARQHSVDKASSMRQGDLGFVRPDGTTDMPRVKVDPALYKAAAAAKDGEIVSTIVPENGKFAVLWRRGSLAANKRTLEQEEASIRNILERKRTDEAMEKLRQSLRAEHVRDENPEPLAALPADLFGKKPARTRPAGSARIPALRAKPPTRTDDGDLR
ncbi:MAG: peptidyl-prolyl cis-trans isomerase, partial [Pseudomonadota bacterium]